MADHDPLEPQWRDYLSKGWCVFDKDPDLVAWIDRSLPALRETIADPENDVWRRYGGTWFAGVNVSPNDADGALPGGPPLNGQAVRFAQEKCGFGALPWDRAQISVCYPGYPQPMAGESDGLFRFRRDRDAAHVDGLLREGPNRRRFLKEYHGFILGIPIAPYDPNAAPLTIWEGSQVLFRSEFQRLLGELSRDAWERLDLTDWYITTRKRAFETCPRVTLHAEPGQAYLVHRHALHGMAPWADGARAGPDGRAIVYFRPPTPDKNQWLAAP